MGQCLLKVFHQRRMMPSLGCSAAAKHQVRLAMLLQQNARSALSMQKICLRLQTSGLSPFLHSNAKVIGELGNAISPAQQEHSQDHGQKNC